MSFSERTNRYRQIFTELKNWAKFNYTNKQISDWTSIPPSKLSRFLNNKIDLKAGEFFYLLECLPKEFQQEFWKRYNGNKSRKQELPVVIANLDLVVLANLLEEIGAEIKQRTDR